MSTQIPVARIPSRLSSSTPDSLSSMGARGAACVHSAFSKAGRRSAARTGAPAGKAAGIALAFFLATLFSVAAFAQSDVGTIVGFVKDQSGAVVPTATVTIRNEGTGEVHTVTTDAAGHYTAPSLQPAYYSMTAEAKGFEKFTSTHNKLDCQQHHRYRRQLLGRRGDANRRGDRYRLCAADSIGRGAE